MKKSNFNKKANLIWFYIYQFILNLITHQFTLYNMGNTQQSVELQDSSPSPAAFGPSKLCGQIQLDCSQVCRKKDTDQTDYDKANAQAMEMRRENSNRKSVSASNRLSSKNSSRSMQKEENGILENFLKEQRIKQGNSGFKTFEIAASSSAKKPNHGRKLSGQIEFLNNGFKMNAQQHGQPLASQSSQRS